MTDPCYDSTFVNCDTATNIIFTSSPKCNKRDIDITTDSTNQTIYSDYTTNMLTQQLSSISESQLTNNPTVNLIPSNQSTVNSELSLTSSNVSSIIRPALSWCSKCGQSTEIPIESKIHKNKNNFKFRKTFNLEESEVLVKSFSCALVDDILFQGTLYASQNYFSFFSRIANKQKKVILAAEKVTEITKEKTAGIFPNAIAIKTNDNRYLLSSFVHREIAYRCLKEIWSSHKIDKSRITWIPENEDEIEDPYDEVIPMIRQKYPEVEYTGETNIVFNTENKKTHDSTWIYRIYDGFLFLKSLIYKEQIQIFIGIIFLSLLTMYTITLAWRIQNFQENLSQKMASSVLHGNCKKDAACMYNERYQNKYPNHIRSSRLMHKDKPMVSKYIIDELKQSLVNLNNLLQLSNRILGAMNKTNHNQ